MRSQRHSVPSSFMHPLKMGEFISSRMLELARHKPWGTSPSAGAGYEHLPHSYSGKSAEPEPYPGAPKQWRNPQSHTATLGDFPADPGDGVQGWLAGAWQAFHPGGGSSFYWCCTEIKAGPTISGENVFPVRSVLPEEAGAAQQVTGALDSLLLKSRGVWLFPNVASPLVGSCGSGSASPSGL